MKVKVIHSIKSTQNKEIDVGEPGNLILLRARGRDSYSFGKLESVVEKKARNLAHPVPCVKFEGDSFLLTFTKLFGMEIPTFVKRHAAYAGEMIGFFDSRVLEEAVSGKDRIIAYLENHPDKRYRGHAEYIRKMVE